MVVRSNLQTYLYNEPFEVVEHAYQQRYPTHPRIPILLGIDVQVDEVDDETGVRHVVRLCRLDLDCPNWLKKMLNQYDIIFRQESWIDPVKREMRLRSTNESWKGKLNILEHCRYFVDPEDPWKTRFEQRAEMTLTGVPMASTCEKFMVRSYNKNTGDGRKIDEEFIKEVVRSGWKEANLPRIERAIRGPTPVQSEAEDDEEEGQGQGQGTAEYEDTVDCAAGADPSAVAARGSSSHRHHHAHAAGPRPATAKEIAAITEAYKTALTKAVRAELGGDGGSSSSPSQLGGGSDSLMSMGGGFGDDGTTAGSGGADASPFGMLSPTVLAAASAVAFAVGWDAFPGPVRNPLQFVCLLVIAASGWIAWYSSSSSSSSDNSCSPCAASFASAAAAAPKPIVFVPIPAFGSVGVSSGTSKAGGGKDRKKKTNDTNGKAEAENGGATSGGEPGEQQQQQQQEATGDAAPATPEFGGAADAFAETPPPTRRALAAGAKPPAPIVDPSREEDEYSHRRNVRTSSDPAPTTPGKKKKKGVKTSDGEDSGDVDDDVRVPPRTPSPSDGGKGGATARGTALEAPRSVHGTSSAARDRAQQPKRSMSHSGAAEPERPDTNDVNSLSSDDDEELDEILSEYESDFELVPGGDITGDAYVLTVPAWVDRQARGEKHIAFIVDVRHAGKRWTCTHRYREFLDLSVLVRKAVSKGEELARLPPFPKKIKTNLHFARKIETRREALQIYLRGVMRIQSVAQRDFVQAFLLPDPLDGGPLVDVMAVPRPQLPGAPVREGIVCRAQHRTAWRDEVLVLMEDRLALYDPGETRTPSTVVLAGEIEAVNLIARHEGEEGTPAAAAEGESGAGGGGAGQNQQDGSGSGGSGEQKADHQQLSAHALPWHQIDCVEVRTQRRSFYFACSTRRMAEEWVAAIASAAHGWRASSAALSIDSLRSRAQSLRHSLELTNKKAQAERAVLNRRRLVWDPARNALDVSRDLLARALSLLDGHYHRHPLGLSTGGAHSGSAGGGGGGGGDISLGVIGGAGADDAHPNAAGGGKSLERVRISAELARTPAYLAFADATCELQTVRLAPLSQAGLTAFFLNVYHTMLIHALIETAPPSEGHDAAGGSGAGSGIAGSAGNPGAGSSIYGSLSSTDGGSGQGGNDHHSGFPAPASPPNTAAGASRRKGLYDRVSYDIGSRLHTLSDIEHSVLRAPSARSSVRSNRGILNKMGKFQGMVVGRFAGRDPRGRFALRTPEPRINFALVTGTRSNPDHIRIYSEAHLDDELESAAREALSNGQVRVIPHRKTVVLPRFLQWYSLDFGPTKLAVATAVSRWLPDAERAMVAGLVGSDPKGVVVSYDEYDWDVRDWFGLAGNGAVQDYLLPPTPLALPSIQRRRASSARRSTASEEDAGDEPAGQAAAKK